MDTLEWMISEGVQVMTRNLGGDFEGPGDGTTPHQYGDLRLIDRAVEAGITFIAPAGNEANLSWFTDTPASIENPDESGAGRIAFADGDTTNSIGYYHQRTKTQRLPKDKRVWAFLRWKDSWPHASTDLDLYLVHSTTGEITDAADDPQTGDSRHIPVERMSLEIPREGQYHLEIVYRGGDIPDWIQLITTHTWMLEHNTRGYSINGPSESANPGMLAAGATFYWDTQTIADFSSLGPTIDGRIKPDIVGATCGQVASYEPHERGENGELCWYGGTSSAGPHVTGLAALVKQRFPDYTPEQIASYLKDNAEQREEPDPNNTWGHGFAILPPPEPPIAPSVLPEEADSNGPNWLRFEWEMAQTKREPVTSFAYHLEQQTDGVWSTHSRGSIEVSGPDPTSSLHTTITGLLAEQVYRFSISATNIWGEGSYSGPVTRETTAPVPPSAPLGLISEPSEDEENAIILTWQAPEDNGGAVISGYLIQVTTDPEGSWSDVVTTESTDTTSYTDYVDDNNGPTFEIGQYPYYRVAAINRAGTGPFSKEATAASPPSSPLGLTAELSEDEKRAIILNWEAPEDNGGAPLYGYIIQAAIDPEDGWFDVITTESTETTYTDHWNDENGPVFEADQSPYYRVAAINWAGTGPFSDEANAGDPLVLKYDTNRNGVIEKDEVIVAINDYLFGDGTISKEDVIKLINLYLFG